MALIAQLAVFPQASFADESADCVGEVDEEADATALAVECEQRVEVLNARTPYEQVFAEPGGSMTLESAVTPQRVPLGNGKWTDVDVTLSTRPDGRIAPAATLTNVSFSAGGGDPLVEWVSPAGNEFFLDWPGSLPAPSIDGDAVLYPEVLSGVDLKVRATAAGFSHFLVVKTPKAAADPAIKRVAFEWSGDVSVHEASDGGVRVVAAGENVAVGSPATMWDSSTASETSARSADESDAATDSVDAPTGGAKTADVAVEVGDGELALVPDADLLSDPDVVFPLVIDPSYAPDLSRWAYANNTNTTHDATPSAAAARVGNDPENGWLYRSLFTFPVSSLKGKQIISAKFKIDLYHSWVCHADAENAPVYLYRSKYPESSRVSWSAAALGDYIGKPETAVASNKDSCYTSPEPTAIWANSNLKANVASAAASYKTMTVAMSARSSDGSGESTDKRWKKFRQSTAVIAVEYNSVPGKPTSMKIGNTACSTSGSVYINSNKPSVSAILKDADNNQKLTGYFEYRPVGGSTVSGTKTDVTEDNRATWAIPTATGLANGAYEWRVRSKDSYDAYGAWTSWCKFEVDSQRPAAPTIASSNDDYLPCTDESCLPSGGPGIDGSFTLTAADTDVVSYLYGWTSPPTTPIATTSGAAQTIPATPPLYGINTLFVQSKDKSGNLSGTASYSFLADRASQPIAGWKLEKLPGAEDQALSSVVDGGKSLSASGDMSWETNARLMDASSASFAGGRAETDGPVVHTDDSFSVSAWVRLDSKVDHATIVGQAAVNRPSFYLKYSKTRDRWSFELPSADVAEPGWTQADSDVEPRLGIWTHLVGVFDAAVGKVQLYVDGVLQKDEETRTQKWHVDGALQVGIAGTTAGDGWSPLDGAVAEVNVFDRVVVGEDFRVGNDDLRPLMEPTLVGQWNFDEDVETTASDTSVWQRPLLLENGASFEPGSGIGSWGLDVDGLDPATGKGEYAATERPIFRTDESFTVSAWARIDDKTADFTVVASEAVHRPSTYLKYKQSTDRWRMTIPTADVADPAWYIAEDTSAVTAQGWYHLAAIYDTATNQMSLYVGGVRVATAAGPTSPWHVDGRLLVGAAGSTDGSQWSFAKGAIDDISIYQGALTADQVADLATPANS